MAKTETAKAKKKVKDLLTEGTLAKERLAVGLTLSDEQIEFIVKLVKASE